MIEWLLQPIDASRAHELGIYLSWHGRLMTLAWAFLVPLGVVIARYFKVTPRQDWPNVVDNRLWWYSHLFCQNTAIVLTIVAIVLIGLTRDFLWVGSYHFMLGWLIAILAISQLIGGLLRGTKGGPTDPRPDGSIRGDHYDMTARRLAFEAIHKTAGYLVLTLAQISVLTGLWQANAPHWMWLGLALWWSALLLVVNWCQRNARRMDTYQALWGPDSKHPGNRSHPSGSAPSSASNSASNS